MKHIFFLLLTMVLLGGCKKEHGTRVDIYVLKSFTAGIDQSYTPPITTITNQVLESIPFVADDDIISYSRDSRTFMLKKDIKAIIQNFGADKAFAVTVDGNIMYCGIFHPAYLSSLPFGIAMIDPILYNNKQLRIDFVTNTGLYTHPRDQRNDDQLIRAFQITGRLR